MNFSSVIRVCVAIAVLSTAAAKGHAEVRLSKIFSSHAVLQRDQPIHVWGWADPAEQITVSLKATTEEAVADRLGRWSVYLPAQPAGGPFELTVSGTNRIVFDDVMIGDVWLASGQSNMEMPLSGFPGSAVVKNAAEEIEKASNTNLRLLLVPRRASQFPADDVEGDAAWTNCTPETAAKFSAVAYFFGREIAVNEHVTVGLIDSTWGGTPAEAWTSLDGLTRDSSLMPVFASWAHMVGQQADMAATIRAESRADEVAKTNHTPMPKHSWHPAPVSWAPGWLFNGMIAPISPYGIKGVIWYQGESNASKERARMYRKVFSTLIQNWRDQWASGDLPFVFTQISSFNAGDADSWPIVRDAQRRTLALRNTGMAVTIDVGDPHNVHPADKQTVGARLATAARAIAYHEAIEYSGPLLRQAVPEKNSMRVMFDHAAGLTAKDADLTGFEIAGDDLIFKQGMARVDGENVVVTSSDVQSPKYVRYAWQNVPTANLINGAGLPASPFTSERID